MKELSFTALTGKLWRHSYRNHLALVAATALAVAILTGALLVGDSMRHSLKTLALGGLGQIESALLSPHFFRETLVAPPESMSQPVAPSIQMEGVARHAGKAARANQVQCLAVDERFWEMGEENKGTPGALECWINHDLARELQAERGDEIFLRLPRPSWVPRDSFWGEKEDTQVLLRLEVTRILPQEGLARFQSLPSPESPLNCFLNLSYLQRRLGVAGQVNACFSTASPDVLQKYLEGRFRLEDAGLRLRRAGPYIALESKSLFLGPREMGLAERAMGRVEEEQGGPLFYEKVLAYLVNQMTLGENSVPYSMAVGVSGLVAEEGQAFLNQWAWDDLKAEEGQTLEFTYYEEGPQGGLDTQKTSLTVAGLLPMNHDYVSSALVPLYEGITDSESVADWDPPFPVDLSRIRPQDDVYWEKYGPAPKLFVSLEKAQELWSHPLGEATGMLWNSKWEKPLRTALNQEIRPKAMGFAFENLRERLGQSAQGNTDFGGLFLGFSLFLLVSAGLIIQVLFLLAVDQRQRELGLLAALGFSRRSIFALSLAEFGFSALLGSILGGFLGLGYGRLMTYGLNHWWKGAVGGSFLEWNPQPSSLLSGWAIGFLLAFAMMAIGLWRLSRKMPVRLLKGGEYPGRSTKKSARLWGVGALAFCGGALVLAFFSREKDAFGQMQSFFLCGSCFLLGLMLAFGGWLKKGEGRGRLSPGLWMLGAKNCRRKPARAFLVTALVAAATFLLVAIGANRQMPLPGEARYSGTGGLLAWGEWTLPLYQDPEERVQLETKEEKELWKRARLYLFALRPGENPSCLNPFQASEPRLLGVPEDFQKRGGFTFTALASPDLWGWEQFPQEVEENPWLLLSRHLEDGSLPVFGDYTTVYWLLHKHMGDLIEVGDQSLRVVGLLRKSIFQSELLLDRETLEKAFPRISGHRALAVDGPQGKGRELRAFLEGAFADNGLDLKDADAYLQGLMQVENTYLAAFLSLGGLGLLLGTLGLAFSLWRNLLERRAEFALLDVLGFAKKAGLLLAVAENGLLILVGMGCGLLAALVALYPGLAFRAAQVPWGHLAGLLLVIAGTGFATSALGSWWILRHTGLEVLKQSEK